jgi:hypothetical protein
MEWGICLRQVTESLSLFLILRKEMLIAPAWKKLL